MARRASKDDLDRFMEHNVHIATKTIYMGSEDSSDEGESGVDSRMAARMVKAIHHLDTSTDINIPLTIIMNNPGGEVIHGMAIYDAIKVCKSKVHIKVFGHAMSMGSIILQAADKRILAPNSRVMIHYGFWGQAPDHFKKANAWLKEEKEYNTWMMDMYLEKIREKKPNFSRKKLDKMLDFDTIFTPQEAVEIGLADEILD